ncbi:MAG: HIT domain-containing protein [Lawsonibacter sp.]|nr:HIT domain-containing protein [Lawsonibacter sp.]
MDCFYCEKDERLLALMTPLATLTWSDIYLFNDQKHRGRCIVALRGHCNEIWQLSDEQRTGFFAEVSAVAEAISRYTNADKINYAIYGDTVSHFHVHLVPKIRDGLQWGGPFADSVPKVTLPLIQFKAVGEGLLTQLDAITEEKHLPAAVHQLP